MSNGHGFPKKRPALQMDQTTATATPLMAMTTAAQGMNASAMGTATASGAPSTQTTTQFGGVAPPLLAAMLYAQQQQQQQRLAAATRPAGLSPTADANSMLGGGPSHSTAATSVDPGLVFGQRVRSSVDSSTRGGGSGISAARFAVDGTATTDEDDVFAMTMEPLSVVAPASAAEQQRALMFASSASPTDYLRHEGSGTGGGDDVQDVDNAPDDLMDDAALFASIVADQEQLNRLVERHLTGSGPAQQQQQHAHSLPQQHALPAHIQASMFRPAQFQPIVPNPYPAATNVPRRSSTNTFGSASIASSAAASAISIAAAASPSGLRKSLTHESLSSAHSQSAGNTAGGGSYTASSSLRTSPVISPHGMAIGIHPGASAAAAPGLLMSQSFPGAVPLHGSSVESTSSILMDMYIDDPDKLATHAQLMEKRRKRRESHNLVERRRRDNINDRIMELAVLVPECQSDGVRANKGIVLKLTADYLRQVLAEKEELAARAARLEEELAKARQT